MDHDNGKAALNPMSLTVADAALLLSKVSGKPVTVDMIEMDLADGAPVNPDDTLNLVHYAAWLVKEMGHAD